MNRNFLMHGADFKQKTQGALQAINPPSSVTDSRRGVALVITLACLVLATFVAMAFFSKALSSRQIEDTSGRIVETELLARSALEVVVSDLKAEIRAGSNLLTQNGSTIFQPAANAAMLPQRTLSGGVSATDTNYAALFKQSVGRFFPNSAPTNLNSVTPIIQGTTGIATNAASSNGRLITGTRWASPRLLGGNATFTNNQLPQWVLITRSGIPANQTWNSAFRDATQSNQNFVIGRFAYNIYEVGGLLDVNVAGYPNGVTASEIGRKGSLGLAALGSIPGVSDPNQFVQNWRNKATGGSATDYLAYLGLSSNTSNPFFNFGAQNGFLKVANTSSSSDHRVLGRQDLINLAAQGTFGITTQALPYLTHFTRELNAPSWGPTTPTGSTIDYAANANNPSYANRFLPNVRVKNSFTRRDGSQAKVGEPLVTTRFPLSKLSWLGKDGPVAPGTAATIQHDFGLAWNNAAKSWNYVGHSGNTVQSSIKTLDQVAHDNREPNFFELLKAGILEGSLGRAADQKTLAGNSTLALEGDEDLQIIRIGANLIDQADNDNFPTTISFAGVKQFGVEDLPYLQNIIAGLRWRYRNNGTYNSSGINFTVPVNISIEGLALVWVPKLFKIHRSIVSPASNPERIRVRISSGTIQSITFLPFNITFGNNTHTSLNVTVPFNLLNPPSVSVPIEIPQANYNNFYNTPKAVEEADVSNPGTALYHHLSFWNTNPGGDRVCGFIPWQMSGTSNHTVTSNSTDLRLLFPRVKCQEVMIALEFFDGQTWRPYDALTGNPELSVTGIDTNAPTDSWDQGGINFGSNQNTQPFGNSIGEMHATFKVDLRTTRWAASHGWQDKRNNGLLDLSPPTNHGFRNKKPFAPPLLISEGNATNAGLFLEGGLSANNNQVPGSDGIWRPNDSYLGPGGNLYRDLTSAARRPVILQRPFRSVGEMSYAFRDTPWQTLGFFHETSGDSGLLDLFCVSESAPVTAGKVNLNSAPDKVLEAVFSGAGKAADGTSAVNASTLASDLITYRDAPTVKAVANKEALVRFISSGNNTDSEVIKGRREAAVRALADVAQTRTWNLLVDLIAQSGRYGVAANSLDKFTVEGERRYWLHLAIDRFTGQVVDSQIELVTE